MSENIFSKRPSGGSVSRASDYWVGGRELESPNTSNFNITEEVVLLLKNPDTVREERRG